MKNSIKKTFIIISIVLLAAVILVSGGLTYFTNYDEACQRYLEKGTQCANTVISFLHSKDFDTYLNEGINETYEVDKKQIQNIVECNDLISIYIFRPLNDVNGVKYIFDCTSSAAGYSDELLGKEIYGLEPDSYENYCKVYNNELNDEYMWEITNNEYGYLASVYLPIFSEDNKVVAAIGIDMSMNEILSLVKQQTYQMSFTISLIIICFAIMLLMIIDFVVIKPLKLLSKEMTTYVKSDQDLEKKNIVISKHHNELSMIAESFNKMTVKLCDYVADLKRVMEEKHKIHAELNVAKKIQASMLPCIFPAFPSRDDFDIYATMDPAKEVGGDFYDFFIINERYLAMTIADVSGKGVAAALFMVIAKTLLKNEAENCNSVEEILIKVNNQLCKNNSEGLFVTAFMTLFDLETGELSYSNAGHNKPLIYRKKTGKFEWLEAKHGFVLAGLDNFKYKLEKSYLDVGDILYLYTDGVTEDMNSKGDLFSDDRLIGLLNTLDFKKITLKDALVEVRNQLDLFAGSAPRSDDITMLIFKNKKIRYKGDIN